MHPQPLWKMVGLPVTGDRIHVRTSLMFGLHNRTNIVVLGDRRNLFRRARFKHVYLVRRQPSSLLRLPFSVFFVLFFNFWFRFFYSASVRGRDRRRDETLVFLILVFAACKLSERRQWRMFLMRQYEENFKKEIVVVLYVFLLKISTRFDCLMPRLWRRAQGLKFKIASKICALVNVNIVLNRFDWRS